MKKKKVRTRFKYLVFNILAAIMATPSVFADTWRTDEMGCAWSCSENPDGTIMITGINPQATGSVIVPASLDGMSVTRIKDNAFRNCIQLTAITIPGSVKHIGSGVIELRNPSSCFRLIFTSDMGMIEVQKDAVVGATKHLEVEVIPKNGHPFAGWIDTDGNEVVNPFCSPMRVVVTPIWEGFGGSSQVQRKRYRPTNKNDSNSETYERSKFCVATVTIDGLDGGGTGFLCEMAGKKYFVTNKHVANQRGRISASFIDGRTMTFGLDSPIDVAVNRDLVRFTVNTELPSLSLSLDTPRIGEQIEFYGNALAHGVVTMTAGKILAVGMERIEIDSPIQGGNSGSPLVLVNSGAVIGVTTISHFNRLDGDPSKVGTRYDPNVKLTREFAVRFVGVEWKSMTYGAFLKSVNVYKDYSKFYVWMKEICIANNQTLVFEYRLPDLQFRGQSRLNNFMKKIARCDEKLKMNVDRFTMMVEKNREKRRGRIGGYGKTEMELQQKHVRDSFWSSYKIRKEVLANVLSCAKADADLSNDERTDVVDAFDRMLRTYCEKFRRQLQGYDLGVSNY